MKKKKTHDFDSDLELSEDERDVKKQKPSAEQEQAVQQTLAQVLTPADFAKLKELNQVAGVERILGDKHKNEDSVDHS
ncbi:hypothetical protein WICPIJ_006960, partial [Wickerhamomyces pijperi]